ncbi:Lon protease [subsurface metagenome]
MSERTENDLKNVFIASALNEETDFIPLITDEDEDSLLKGDIPDTLPILPLRNTVLFPGVIIPISVGRKQSMKLIRDIYKKSKIIGTVAQKDPNNDAPVMKDLYSIGTVAQIIRILEMPDGTTSVIIQGKRRFLLAEQIKDEPYLIAKVEQLNDFKPLKKDTEFEAIVGSLKDLSLRIIKLSSSFWKTSSTSLFHFFLAPFSRNSSISCSIGLPPSSSWIVFIC